MAKKRKRYTATDGKLFLVLQSADEGGYTVTSPFIPGMVTEAETLEEAFEMARDAATTLKTSGRKRERVRAGGRTVAKPTKRKATRRE
jgi:predicted RNase H-like HicB family nuclease